MIKLNITYKKSYSMKIAKKYLYKKNLYKKFHLKDSKASHIYEDVVVVVSLASSRDPICFISLFLYGVGEECPFLPFIVLDVRVEEKTI